METALRRLDGVDRVVVSMEKQMFAVTYVPDARFRPGDLRDAAAVAHVDVVRFHIAAHGEVRKDGTKRFLVAGDDRFLLVDPPEKLPVGASVGVVGVVDDSGSPLRLKLDDFKPLDQ